MMNSLWPIGGTSQLSFWNPLAEGTVALGGKAPQPRVRVGTQHVPQGPGEPAPSAHGGAGPVQGGLARCVHSRWGQKGLAQQWVWQIAGTGPWGGGDAFEITMFLSRQELALRALRACRSSNSKWRAGDSQEMPSCVLVEPYLFNLDPCNLGPK